MKRPSTPPPASAPAPTPVTAVLEPKGSVPSGTPQLPAFAQLPGLATLGAMPTQVAPAMLERGGGGLPYVLFYSDRSPEHGRKIVLKFPNVQDGDPFIPYGDTYVPVIDAAFITLADFPYWCKLDGKFQKTAVRLTSPGRQGKEVPEADKWKAQVLSQLLVIPDANGKIDERLAPASLTLTTFRTVKCDFPKALLAAQEATLKPEWVTQNPMHGVMIQSGIPPKFRVCASMRRAPGTSRGSGNSFVAMDAVVSTLTVPQIDAVLNQWFQSPEGQAEIKATQEAFDAEVKALTAFAERTGK